MFAPSDPAPLASVTVIFPPKVICPDPVISEPAEAPHSRKISVGTLKL